MCNSCRIRKIHLPETCFYFKKNKWKDSHLTQNTFRILDNCDGQFCVNNECKIRLLRVKSLSCHPSHCDLNFPLAVIFWSTVLLFPTRKDFTVSILKTMTIIFIIKKKEKWKCWRALMKRKKSSLNKIWFFKTVTVIRYEWSKWHESAETRRM